MFVSPLQPSSDVCLEGFDIIGPVSDGQSALTEVERLHPDVLVLDVSMPGISGIETARRLKKSMSNVKVIFLSVHENCDYIREARAVGGRGYVIKSRLASDLANAIKAVHADHSFFPEIAC